MLSFIKRLGHRRQQGRVLLVTNRAVARERWTESHEVRYLNALEPEEAISHLTSRLDHVGKKEVVPPNRHSEVVRALGFNPRAIAVFAEALRYEDSLDEPGQTHENILIYKEKIWSPDICSRQIDLFTT
jgi:hypothetical protein